MYTYNFLLLSQSKALIHFLKYTILAATFSLLLLSCNSDDPFTITPTSVGPLTQQTQVKEIESLFKEDSIVNQNQKNSMQNGSGIITVYEKGGTKLLSLIPATKGDTANIKTVQIFDKRYKTAEGVSLNSTFKEVQESYKISKVESLLSTIIVFVDELNAYFTIDKKELPSELRVGPGTKVEPVQIPDNARIKYFMIGW